jgi:hypothetical protein
VEALEAQANHIGDINKMVPPPVATDEDLSKIWDSMNTYKEIRRAIYSHGVAHGQARSQEVAEPAPVAGGLVEQVTNVINTWDDSPEGMAAKSKAALLVVAKWLRERHRNDVPDMLEQEAGQ